MAHIVSFTIHGLAGRKDPLAVTLHRDINVFFGLNGSGKTSLLKILHAAMANETGDLDLVPFASAEVQIYSLDRGEAFTRSLEKQPVARRTRSRKHPDIRRASGAAEGMAAAVDTVVVQDMRWTCSPSTPADVSTLRWAHEYLPISRLHVSDDPFLMRSREVLSSRPWPTERQLDEVFARYVESLWIKYSAGVFGAVRKAQERGLASILRAVLSTQSAKSKRHSKLASDRAYERVNSFLARQGSKDLLDSKEDFEKRYAKDRLLQDVVQDIDSVEDAIKAVMSPRNTLQDLIARLFAANKVVQFTDQGIQVDATSGENIGLQSLSSGEKHLLRILVASLLAGPNTLIIDEPEISMHVDWQKDLVRLLTSLNAEAQLILATHSPEVMADVPDDKIFRL